MLILFIHDVKRVGEFLVFESTNELLPLHHPGNP